jgi:CRISPR/Cas system-associated protein Cas10 (large subunit of type III CRISPR-Cas system)
MSSILLSGEELMKSIDALTHEISEKINNNELEVVSELLEKRLELLSSLVELSASETNRETILNYLIDLQNREHKILQSVSKEHDLVKKALINLNHLKQYVINSI